MHYERHKLLHLQALQLIEDHSECSLIIILIQRRQDLTECQSYMKCRKLATLKAVVTSPTKKPMKRSKGEISYNEQNKEEDLSSSRARDLMMIGENAETIRNFDLRETVLLMQKL